MSGFSILYNRFYSVINLIKSAFYKAKFKIESTKRKFLNFYFWYFYNKRIIEGYLSKYE